MMTEPLTQGPSSQPSFTEFSHRATISGSHAPDHAPWMDVSTQISSLGTRMEELALVHDTRFYSMEEHMDHRLHSSISSRALITLRVVRSQHEEMMAYLCSVFPPPPPQP
ncbi:hypothetical protein CK203_078974 [Vitis vinifera]|uniref:Uncharacterized protein n=1 Tax=Vitis vinifera TaxID=29760 RepID=A0A438DA15_VITVI|nr:hypothetical protein CK203_078974 [Vitis vinifera]